MTESDYLLDTSAWWEILRGSRVGQHVSSTILEDSRRRTHTSAITVGELSAKLATVGGTERGGEVLAVIRRAGDLHDVTPEIAFRGGLLRAELRLRERDASLADGIILATARLIQAKLVSSDPAFIGQPELVRLD